MRKIANIFLCVLIITLLQSNKVVAYERALSPEEIDLGDGMVFLLNPDDIWFPDGRYSDLPPSGLYNNNELIYTVEVDAYWWEKGLWFSKDAITFFLIDDEAIRFYEEGIFIFEYLVIGDIIKGSRESLPTETDALGFTRSIWHFFEHLYYNRAENIFCIVTTEYREITFDLSNGLIISEVDVDHIIDDNSGVEYDHISDDVSVEGFYHASNDVFVEEFSHVNVDVSEGKSNIHILISVIIVTLCIACVLIILWRKNKRRK
jgi:hypothetical protein